MGRLFPLTTTPGISDAASRWLSGDRWEIAEPRRASTVMLVRDASGASVAPDASAGSSDAAGGPEVFMLRRVSEMEFAPSMHVFPGGGVDDRDGEGDLPWSGPSPLEWGERLGCSPTEAQLYVAAAVRELFEECGVLLASPSASGPLAWVGDAEWRQVRADLVSRAVSLREVLVDRGLVLRSDLIAAKAHWLTPEFEPRRYDTWFFAAVMPPSQTADGDTTEADLAEWVRPADLLREYAAGSALMLPPTVICVEQVREAVSASDFVAHADLTPLVMPEVVDAPGGAAMEVVERV